MKQAIEEIEKETPSVDKLLVDEEDDKKSENGEKTQLMTKKMQRRKERLLRNKEINFIQNFKQKMRMEHCQTLLAFLKFNLLLEVQ